MEMTASEVDRHVGQRMRRRREFLGISQGRLGQHLGLTFSQVQKYEKGANRIGAGRLYQLSIVLGVPIQYFFEGLPQEGPAEGPAEAAPAEPPRTGRGDPSGAKSTDLAVLDEAFRAIADDDTRRSLIALVCSLGDPVGDRVGGSRAAPAPDPQHAVEVGVGPGA